MLLDSEPDNICYVNDVVWGGGDRLSMPVTYVYVHDVYIHDVYIHDWILDRRDQSCTKPQGVAKILRHKTKLGRTEANNGGDDYRKARNEMTSFSVTVKNVHDDAADSMTMLADYLANGIKTVSVGKRPF